MRPRAAGTRNVRKAQYPEAAGAPGLTRFSPSGPATSEINAQPTGHGAEARRPSHDVRGQTSGLLGVQANARQGSGREPKKGTQAAFTTQSRRPRHGARSCRWRRSCHKLWRPRWQRPATVATVIRVRKSTEANDADICNHLGLTSHDDCQAAGHATERRRPRYGARSCR